MPLYAMSPLNRYVFSPLKGFWLPVHLEDEGGRINLLIRCAGAAA